MKRTIGTPIVGTAFLALTLALAACGGGGGGGGGTSGGGGGVPPTNPPPTNPPPQSATGQMTIGGAPMANATVGFTCGCTQQAGQVIADASGNYTITIPASMFGGASGTYTPPGHNLMVIGFAQGSHAQTYSMEFLGNTPSHNVSLTGTTTNVADKFTTAAALYVYYQTQQYYVANPSPDNTYDIWNFNTLVSFEQSLAAHGGNNAAETKLISDIVAAQASGTSLYPAVPSWDKTSGDTVNATIVNDIKAVATSGDAALPTICASSCTGTPTP